MVYFRFSAFLILFSILGSKIRNKSLRILKLIMTWFLKYRINVVINAKIIVIIFSIVFGE